MYVRLPDNDGRWIGVLRFDDVDSRMQMTRPDTGTMTMALVVSAGNVPHWFASNVNKLY